MFEIIKTVKKGDYLYAVVPNHPNAIRCGYVLHHRVVMENHIGRVLEKNEVVHHKDENKHNNQIDNLELMTSSEHAKLHSPVGRAYVQLVCAYCGVGFQREKRQTKYSKSLCSRRCNALYNRTNANWLGRSVKQIDT